MWVLLLQTSGEHRVQHMKRQMKGYNTQQRRRQQRPLLVISVLLTCYSWHTTAADPYSRPNQPRASTREYAVVGATDAPIPMNDLVRPFEELVATRGVACDGNGNALVGTLDVTVIVAGVRIAVANVGDGGKTNNVCEGVADTEDRDGIDCEGKAI